MTSSDGFDPKRGLTQIQNRAQFLEMGLDDYLTVMQELLELSMPSSLAGERISGGYSTSPTEGAVFAYGSFDEDPSRNSRQRVEAERDDFLTCLQRSLVDLNRARNLMDSRPRRASLAAMEAAKGPLECRCRYALEPWGDPMCGHLVDPRLLNGLDPSCYRRKLRYEADPENYVPRVKRRRVDPRDGSEIHNLIAANHEGTFSGECSCGEWSVEFCHTAGEVEHAHASHRITTRKVS